MEAVNLIHKTVAEIVREDYRTADVFKKYGINYCCSGQVPLQDACTQKGVALNDMVAELDESMRTIHLPNSLQFNNWKIDFLIDYIVNIHHAYLYHTLPELENNFLSFVNGHRKKYPELQPALDVFSQLSAVIIAHARQEEDTIFPYIKQIDNTYRRKETYGSLFVRTMRKPLTAVESEHNRISDLLRQLRVRTRAYTFPDGACTNYQVIFRKLKEFDSDMVQHEHLENNVLFPKAMEMERALLQL